MPALICIERPKMSVEMWDKLKSYILRQREKRKQEQEQDAEQERHRREQELKRKRDAMTLEDIKDQLQKLEIKLKELKEEKHELFLQLKRVLNEDEVRKRVREKEAEMAAQQAMSLHSFHSYYMPSTTMIQPANCQPNLYHRIAPINASMFPTVVGNKMTAATLPPQISNPSSTSVTTISRTSSPASIALKKLPTKRLHEKSPSPSPPPGAPYTGLLPVYKTNMPYTQSVPRTSSGSYQLYYPPAAPSQLAYDAKGNPYHILPSGQAFPAEASSLDSSDYEAKYYQQLRGINTISSHPSSSSIIPIQTGQTKPGGITGGIPVSRVSGSGNVPCSTSAPSREVREVESLQYSWY